MSASVTDVLYLPMPLLWLLLLALVLWRWQRLSHRLFAATTLLFLVLSLPAVGTMLTLPLKTAAPALDETVDLAGVTIMVPTAGVFDDSDGQWWATIQSTRRVVAGQLLQKRLNLPMIIAGGGPYPDQPPEAEALARQFQFDMQKTRLEVTARNTDETGKTVAAMLAGDAGLRVIVVTDDTHIARMSASLRHYGAEVIAVSLAYPGKDRDDTDLQLSDLLPTFPGFAKSRSALWEYLGIAWYLATGRLDFGDL